MLFFKKKIILHIPNIIYYSGPAQNRIISIYYKYIDKINKYVEKFVPTCYYIYQTSIFRKKIKTVVPYLFNNDQKKYYSSFEYETGRKNTRANNYDIPGTIHLSFIYLFISYAYEYFFSYN